MEKEKYLKKIKEKFKLIEDYEISFKSYSYSTGVYYYYDEEYNYEYYDDEGLAIFLEEAYKYAISLVNEKEYELSLSIFDLIINTDYSCKETSDSLYGSEIIDCYEIDLETVEKLLHFTLKELYSYAIYTSYFCKNRYKFIYNFISEYKKITFEECINIGNEKMNNLDEFYKEWIEYLTMQTTDISEKILISTLDNYKTDEYLVCKKTFKTHPKLYLNFVLKLYDDCNYEKIIETYEEAFWQIEDLKIKEEISFIAIDSINNCKNDKNKDKYYYNVFESVKSIPNFLILIKKGLYSNKIKKYIDTLSYKSDKLSDTKNKCYFDFFLGDFETIYLNIFEKEDNIDEGILNLMILYLSDTKIMNSAKEIILMNLTFGFNEYQFKNLGINSSNKYLDILSKFDDWKQKNKIDEQLEKKYMDKIQSIIDYEVAINLENKREHYYDTISRLVVLLDKILAKNNYIKPQEYIEKIEKKYFRFRIFRNILKKYKEDTKILI